MSLAELRAPPPRRPGPCALTRSPLGWAGPGQRSPERPLLPGLDTAEREGEVPLAPGDLMLSASRPAPPEPGPHPVP